MQRSTIGLLGLAIMIAAPFVFAACQIVSALSIGHTISAIFEPVKPIYVAPRYRLVAYVGADSYTIDYGLSFTDCKAEKAPGATIAIPAAIVSKIAGAELHCER